MNSVQYFEIQADDPHSLMAFYGEIFDWKFYKQEYAPVEYWHIETSGITGGLMQRPKPVPPLGHGTNAFLCSIQVEDFDMTAQKILEHGGMVVMEKFAVPGKCWQGYFLDTQGNTFGLFQVDENAA